MNEKTTTAGIERATPSAMQPSQADHDALMSSSTATDCGPGDAEQLSSIAGDAHSSRPVQQAAEALEHLRLHTAVENMPDTISTSAAASHALRDGGGAVGDSGGRIWSGDLHVRGNVNHLAVSCVAVRYCLPERPPLQNTDSWPSKLQCNPLNLKSSEQLLEHMSESLAQWYVRFTPVNADGDERDEPRLERLAQVIAQRKLVYVVECNEGAGAPGTLYLWGMPMQPHGFSLLGVFRPRYSVIDDMPRFVSDGSSSGGPAGADGGQRIWTGNLHVRGHHNDMLVPCVAVQYSLPEKTPLQNTDGWPSQLQCDSTKLKSSEQLLAHMSESTAQWYVRFTPVDANGNEKEEPKLIQLVKVMVQRKLAFEIECNEGVGTPGTLYLWGMPMQPHGYSLLGVFSPQ